MLDRRTFVVTSAASGARLDRFLREQSPELSRREILTLFRSGHVRMNGRLAPKGALVQPGDLIEVIGMHEQAGPAEDHDLALRIIYEDAHLVAVDKPAGVPSHALRAGERGTVVSALLARYPATRGVGYRELESGLLHRLDNDTSGVLLATKDQPTFEQMRVAHERGEFDKRYLALVSGVPSPRRVDAYLKADRRRVEVHSEPCAGAKAISTELVSCTAYAGFGLVCVRVALAARHQIRAQLAALGHPIVGDALYAGASLPGLGRHFLHASELTFPHGADRITLRSPLPLDLQSVLDTLAI